MANDVLTGQEVGEAEARARTVEAIESMAVARLGDSLEVRAQVRQIGAQIAALSVSNGRELERRIVSWEIRG